MNLSSPKLRLLITGGTGFVGRNLLISLMRDPKFEVVVAVRNSASASNVICNSIVVGEVNGETDWLSALKGIDVVVHLAGRAHVFNELSGDPLESFRSINLRGTTALAEQAIISGVKRFVFISSIGVNGTLTKNSPFSELCPPNPQNHYALSKLEAETALRNLAKESSMEWVIIRPPLVYNATAPGNFNRLLKIVHSGMPLPLASVNNSKSIVAVENLVAFIMLCSCHPAAANELFLISDGVDVSTSEIILYLSEGMEKKSRLFRVPSYLIRNAAWLLGQSGAYAQLCGSLVICSKKANDLLGWQPLLAPDVALKSAGLEYKKSTVR